MTKEEAEELAAAGGLTLVPSSSSGGYLGVKYDMGIEARAIPTRLLSERVAASSA